MKAGHSDFAAFLARHGEVVTQAVVENLERYEGVRSDTAAPLTQRWSILTQKNADLQLQALRAFAA